MDKNRKKQLQMLFEAPKPSGKRKFFREIEPKPVGMRHILGIQFSYISKWSWVAAAMLLAETVYFSHYYKQWLLGIVLPMMPLLVLAGVAESVRSSIYGMEELEMSSRLSLKSILLARMVIVGIEDVLLALFFAWMVGGEYGSIAGKGSFLRTMLYLFVPYLMAAFGSLWIVRNFAGKEELYACTGFVLAVSVMIICSMTNFRWIYEEKYLSVWLGAAGVLGGLTLYESRKMLRTAQSFIRQEWGE